MFSKLSLNKGDFIVERFIFQIPGPLLIVVNSIFRVNYIMITVWEIVYAGWQILYNNLMLEIK